MDTDPAGARFGRDIATLREPRGPVQARRERRLRRAGLALLGVVVVAALAGLLGGRQATVTASSEPVTLTVEYPRITRPGIEAPLTIRVHRAGGFDGPVTVAVEAVLFEKVDFNSWFPTPSSETADGRYVMYEFDAPAEGDTFTAHLDAHAQSTQGPSARRYAVVLLDQDDRVDVEFRMWVMP